MANITGDELMSGGMPAFTHGACGHAGLGGRAGSRDIGARGHPEMATGTVRCSSPVCLEAASPNKDLCKRDLTEKLIKTRFPKNPLQTRFLKTRLLFPVSKHVHILGYFKAAPFHCIFFDKEYALISQTYQLHSAYAIIQCSHGITDAHNEKT
jgi:hypothetical protein